MKQKLTKISDEDFDGLLPSAPSLPVSPIENTTISEQASEAATAIDQSSAVVKTSKAKKAKPTISNGISIRLTFSTADYKSLTMLALSESEKVNKRVSVTSLLLSQANKLIKKGATNA